MSEPRRGNWARVVSGGRFYPLDPRPEEIHIGDIAHALSNVGRFGGHTIRFYSVAQHSVLVSKLLGEAGHPPDTILRGLLHDAAEAYIGDMIRPLKLSPEMDPFRAAEYHIMRCVFSRSDLVAEHDGADSLVHWADDVALATEARDLMGGPTDWDLPYPPDPRVIHPCPPLEARHLFMAEFNMLMRLR